MLILALLSVTLSAHAAENISLVVPFAAGGPGDKLARTIQSRLNNDRYQFNVEYMTGAGGVVAANNVAKIKDKTVLLLMGNGINTAKLQGTAQYTYDDFVTVKHLGEDRLFLIVKNDGDGALSLSLLLALSLALSLPRVRARSLSSDTLSSHSLTHRLIQTHTASRSKDKKDSSTASGLAFTMPEPELLDSSDDGSWSEVKK